MELKQAYQQAMANTANMALATSVENEPNVRVITFGYNPERPNVVFFSTFKGNKKIEEFKKNPEAAAILLPEDPESATQVRIHGKVVPSGHSLAEITEWIVQKMPDYAAGDAKAAPMLEAYELQFSQAEITIGMSRAQILKIDW